MVPRPVDEVFAFTEDPANAPDWAEGIVDLEILEETEDHVGSRYRMVVQEGKAQNAYEGEVLVWEENRRTLNRVERDGQEMDMERTYEPVAGGTRVTLASEYELEGWAKLFLPVAWLMNRRFLKRQTAKLKELLEAET